MCNIQFFNIQKNQVFLYGIRAGSLNFFLLLSRSRHYSHHIDYFSGEHHRLLFISYLCKPKTEVTSRSKVDLVEPITLVCNRLPEKLPHALTRQMKSACCLTRHLYQSASDPHARVHFTRLQPVGLTSAQVRPAAPARRPRLLTAPR